MNRNREAHLAALRAAARVALATTIIAGCAASDDEQTKTESTELTSAKVARDLDADPGSAQWLPCCWDWVFDLDSGTLNQVQHDDGTADGGAPTCSSAGLACTPWGPPVPPAMRRRAVA